MKNKNSFAEDRSFRRGELYLADMRGLSHQGKTEILVVIMQNDPATITGLYAWGSYELGISTEWMGA